MESGYKKCPYCGEEIKTEAIKCRYCGSDLLANTCPPPHRNDYQYNDFERNDAFANSPEGKSRGVAALLAIFLGGLGIHYFYMGKNTAGVIYLIAGLLTCECIVPILGLIQGIIMFGMTNQAWRAKYITSQNTFPF